MLSHQRPFFNSLGMELPPWEQESYHMFCLVALHFVINYLFLHFDLSTQNAWLQALSNYLYEEKEVILNCIFKFDFTGSIVFSWGIKVQSIFSRWSIQRFIIVVVNIPIKFYGLDREQCEEGPGRPPVTPIIEDSSPSRGESLPHVCYAKIFLKR